MTPPTERPARLHWIDTAKGIGIILVVFGHAWRGAFDAGVLRDAALFRVVDSAIYAWHMPLFFFSSGLLFLDVLLRTHPTRLIKSRLRQLLWPFALWTWIFFGVKLLAGQSANHPVTLADFPLIPLPPYEHLWFLWALFLAQLATLGMFLLLRPVLMPPTLRIAFGLAAVLLIGLIPFVPIPSLIFGAAVAHFPFFIAGIAAGRIVHLGPPTWLAALSAIAFMALLTVTPAGQSALLVALCLTLGACIVVAWLDSGSEAPKSAIRVLRYLGLYSLAIFLAHTIFSAALRIALLRFGVDEVTLHLVLAVAIGLIGPIVMVWISQKLGVARLLGF